MTYKQPQFAPSFLILFGLPFFLLLINANWIYSPEGMIDPWIYHGYFRNFVKHLRDFFPYTYYGSRMSWTLPGHLIYSFLPPLAANVALHLVFYYMAIFSFNFVMATFFGRKTALLASVLFGTHGFFLYAIGWDYVDGAASAYYLLTFAFLVKGLASKKPFIWFVLAGATHAASIYAYIHWLSISPMLLSFYLIFKKNKRNFFSLQDILSFFKPFCLGAALLTIIFEIIHYGVSGRPWFFAPSILASLNLVTGSNAWYKPVSTWIGTSYWLVIPAIAFMSSLVIILCKVFMRRLNEHPVVIFFAINLIYTFSVKLCEQWLGQPTLQHDYMASMLIPATFFALGSQYCYLQEKIGLKFFAISLSFLIVFLAVPFSGFKFHLEKMPILNLFILPPTIVFPLAIGILAVGLRQFNHKRTNLIAILFLCLVLFNVNASVRFSSKQHNAGSFSRITKSMEIINQTSRNQLLKPRFWYNLEEQPYGGEFTSIASTYLWGYTLINTNFPELEQPPEITLLEGQSIILLSAEVGAAQKAIESLGRFQIRTEVLKEEQVCEDRTCYPLIVLRVM